MRYYHPFILLILSIVLCPLTRAQEYIFDAQLLTTDDGLANLMTNAIHQDKQGIMWMSTPYGLNSYDGYSFRHYTKGKNGLHDNKNIHKIKEDKEGNLWLFYLNRLSIDIEVGYAIDVFDKKTEKAISLEKYIEEELPFNITETNHSFIIDPKKRLWLTTSKGELFLYEKGEFQKIYTQGETTLKYVTIDEQDNIWLGYEKDIICINQSGELLGKYKSTYNVHGIWSGENQTIWLASLGNRGLFISHKKKDSKEFEQFILSDKKNAKINERFFPGIHRGQNGFWHIISNYQSFLFDRNGAELVNFNTLIDIEKFQVEAHKYFESENHIWWCTPTGILKTSIKKNPFQVIHQNEEGLSDCRGITEDDFGNIYFLNQGLYLWEPQNSSLSKILPYIHSGYAYALTYKDNLLFSGTYDTEILGYKLDLRTKEQTIFQPLRGTDVFCTLASETENKLLVGTNTGIEYIDIENDKVLPFEKYKIGNATDELLKKSTVYHLHQNASGIWAATDNGVFLVDEEQGILGHFDDSNVLPFNYIMHIHEDKEGVFWLATKGGGVIKWQPAQDKKSESIVQQFTTKDGLSNNYLYAIYEDDYDRLWIPSDKGLMYMDKHTHQVLKTYLVEDGLAHNEFNTSSHYQAKDGTLYFGGLGGMISFHPNSIPKESSNQTPLEFISFKVLEQDAEEMTDKTTVLKTADEIVLKPNDKLFELRFALLDYDKSDRHQYTYQIQGYTDNWQSLEHNYLRITNLPFGTYTLNIRGKNINKDWSENELSLTIRVLTPFYFQWWFIALLLFGAIAAVVAFIKWREINFKKEQERLEKEVQNRTLTIQQQAEELKELDKAKTRFFSNITHEIRTPLTLIIGPLEQLLEEQASLSIRQRLFGVFKNARQLLTLINQLLDLSKLEGKRMRIEISQGDIVEYTHELILRFQSLAENKNQKLHFNSKQDQWKTNFDKNKWSKIIHNLVSNAIKFTPKGGTIEVQLRKVLKDENEAIQLIVKDTGIGMDEEALNQIFNRFYQVDNSSTRVQGGTGIGLSLVKELVELQEGTITAKSEVETGTTFEIVLPVLQKDASLPNFSLLEDEFSPSVLEEPTLVPVQIKANISQTPSLNIEKDKLTLLLIEDNDEMRAYIRQCLDESTYQILEAGDGEEGIDHALTHVPDLIISDVMMPRKNGFEVLRAIRSNLVTSHIPVILLTAKASLESRLEGLKRGADAYLTKPFSPQELTLRIQKLIEIRRMLQARYRDNLDLTQADTGQFEQEDAFIIELKTVITNNLSDSEFSGEMIGKHFGVSRTALYHKVKALTGQAISEYIRSVRLEVAYKLIRAGNLNLSEIAYETGFSSLSHFSRTFKKAYRKAPSEIQRKI